MVIPYFCPKPIGMASIENEIVRFVAEMELDPQDQAAFVEGLKKAEQQCESFRKSIADTGKQMAKLKAEGKENSEEYGKLSKEMKSYRDGLKAATKDADSYSSALNINQMSINQLNKHARTLRTTLSAMHKEANPALWNKYNKELIQTEDRLRQVQIGTKGIQEPMLSIRKLFGDIKSPQMWGLALTGALSVAKNIFQQMTEQTQVWGDKWTMAQAKLSAGWNQFIANLGQGQKVVKASINDAIKAAERAQQLRDELFERENSYSIQEIKLQTEINDLQAIVNDRSKPEKERLSAVNSILQKEQQLADMKKSIADQELKAATDELATRTQLNTDELKAVIDEYELNIEQIRAGQEYNALLKEREKIQHEMSSAAGKNDQFSVSFYADQLDEIDKKIKSVTDVGVLKFAELARQYDLGNDNLVENYVEAVKKVLIADRDYSAAVASQARRRGSLINQIQSEEAEDRQKALEKELADAQKNYNEQLNSLKLSLLNREITETEYKAKSSALEISFLNQKKAINQTYGLDVTEIEGQIYDKRLGLQNQFNDKFLSTDENFTKLLEKQRAEANKSIEKLLAEMNSEVDKLQGELEQDSIDEFDRLLNKANTGIVTKDAKIAKSDADFDTEMADLESLHNFKLISEEEYLARKSELVKSHTQEVMQIETEGWNNALGVADQILGQMSNAISSAREAEYASLDAWKAKELAAAGDNAEKREQIEAEYEAKKLDIQKKYADIDMGIQIAKAIAAGALAIMQGFAQLGPVAGGVMAALITATTAAQIATIVAQRNAIKNASAESASASTATQSSTSNVAVGFSDGGYTGDGGRTEVAGVVHRGEYVVPQPELKIPYVQSLVAAIESKRRQRTSRNALPGFAEGGYTDVMTNQQDRSDSRILNQIYYLLTKMSKQPIKAYTVLSEMEAKQDMRNRFKRMTSLRRN